MRRLAAGLIYLLAPANTFAGEAVFDRLQNDFQKLAYCVGFWNGIERARGYGLDVEELAYDPVAEIDVTQLALQEERETFDPGSNRVLAHLGPDFLMLRYFEAGSSEIQTALRYSKRMIGLDMQTAAQSLIELIRPVCAKAASSSEVSP